MSTPKVTMIIGAPASGKSSHVEAFKQSGFVVLNRDTEGGRVIDLLPKLESKIVSGINVVLDNLFTTAESRAPFIAACKKIGVPIDCLHVATSLEEAQINALYRMWERYQQIFWVSSDINNHPQAKKDPNIFPVAVLFKYRKDFQKPQKDEGFAKVEVVQFKRVWKPGQNKAVIFDYDDTLRTVTEHAKKKYPCSKDEVVLMPGRKSRLAKLKKDGWMLLGVSNQSGVARGDLSEEEAADIFYHTNALLGQGIQVGFCPHNVPPNCYCRKPQSGMGIHLICEFDLDVTQCIFVGDQTTDKTFAKRLGIEYVDQADFF